MGSAEPLAACLVRKQHYGPHEGNAFPIKIGVEWNQEVIFDLFRILGT